MSFYSSLILLYPGPPPLLTVEELRQFCDRLREGVPFKGQSLKVELAYGAPTQAAFEETHQISWDETKTIATLPVGELAPDYAKEDKPWEKLWPMKGRQKTLHGASCRLGIVPSEMYQDLSAEIPDDRYNRIGPDSLSVEIGCIYCRTMGADLPDDADICHGFFGLRISGYGYFTWQPLETYWRKIKQSPSLKRILAACRAHYPVPPLEHRVGLEKDLGRIFLNREEYQPGDWIVSISESG